MFGVGEQSVFYLILEEVNAVAHLVGFQNVSVSASQIAYSDVVFTKNGMQTTRVNLPLVTTNLVSSKGEGGALHSLPLLSNFLQKFFLKL